MAHNKASSTEELVKRRSEPCGCLGWFSAKITGSMENAFYRLLLRSTGIPFMSIFVTRWGEIVSCWPWSTVILSLVGCGILSGGLLLWYQETDDELLWTPYNSPVISQGLMKHINTLNFSLLPRRLGFLSISRETEGLRTL